MTTPQTSGPAFETPRHVASAAECWFYHSVDLPELGLQVGPWDLRSDIENYLGRYPLQGKRVIDVGAASGYVTFEMEKRGADVISFDRRLDDFSDDGGLLPFQDFEKHFGLSWESALQHRRSMSLRLQNSYWFAHRMLGSRARLLCGNVYEGPVGVESVDVSFFGCILLHLRDPLLALKRFADVTREALIVTETFEDAGRLADLPVLVFRPNVKDSVNIGTWWWPTPKLLETYLRILGFKQFEVTRHEADYVDSPRPVPMFTLVARR